ncbi:hypothetical protein [Haloarchaeobius iranensis]|uniref:Uncharacterized protein n=1 Tax=Haloarchaeobius iranensis TaxID=996166 RepID=A0A1G9U1Y5_9EURY|nr:hypothetical protein [Haloarchaeobius iranensis]SDM54017.1 hypothetical protein SAMN05192554_103264 [Haloarchaeobius iranensis]
MDEQVSVDPGRITEHLDAAERALDAAAVSDPTAEQQAAIDDLRALVASFRDLTSALEAMAAGFDGLRVGIGQFENQEFETAASTFESATTSFERAGGAIEDATADAGRLESEGTDASVSEYRDSLSDLEALTAAGSSLSEGTRLLSLAFDRFFVAAEAYDDGAYESAIEPFGTARDYAAEGVTAYAAPDELPPDVGGSIASLQCSAENLRDGADHYQQAAEAGANGNTESRRDHEEQAAAALNRDCGGAGDRAATVRRAARLAVAR